MPILLNDIQASAPTRIFSPKFFDAKLTGSGKKIGLLNDTRNPVNIDPAQQTLPENIQTKKRKYTNGQTEVSCIPVDVLPSYGWDYMLSIPMPNTNDLVEIGTFQANGVNGKMYMKMLPNSIILEETYVPHSGTTKKVTPCYQMFVYAITDSAKPSIAQCVRGAHHLISNESQYLIEYTCNPRLDWAKLQTKITNGVNRPMSVNFNNVAIDDYIATYNLYNGMCKRSEEWQTTIDVTLDILFENINRDYIAANVPEHKRTGALNELAHILRRIEDYGVPLDLYRNIYGSVKKHFPADIAVTLCKQNLNLLLSDTLNNLNQNKAILTRLPNVQPPANTPVSLARFSPEQRNAVTSTDPLVLVQAGAGTGKSTVILGRIDWMIACGIDPKDITVLSFTNAAADNITAKNPNVHSMTIARMIHTIYSANFPRHELSSIDTIVNSLDIYYPGDDTAMRFKHRLIAITKNDNDAFTSMNNFIEHHYDEVISMLDTIQQTSLELEIVICYQKIDTFIEPPEVQSKYLIIDEVQDNSIFEFIYTLKYVDKHKESLFIVGDCSQTLYEFRASNPKALNVLEGSGVFTAYQLQVNYRSNQEILDFANVTLRDIEANQYANIQLRANSLKKVTEQSFTDAVHFAYHRIGKLKDFNDALPTIFANDLKPYIQAKLDAGEQVAFLAFTRNHVYRIQNLLEGMFPDKKIVNLVPEKMYNSTVFSEFIKKYWDEIQFVPTQSICSIIANEVTNRLTYLVYNHEKVLPVVGRMLANWRQQSQPIIDAWQAQHMAGRMTLEDFLKNVKDSMLQFEIRTNAVRQALLSAKNEETKKSQNSADADLVLSTIHSAKGLEFDNVVVIYRNENDLPEDKKRMYYVAFTRAMKSEFIVAYDTVVSPKIQSDYETIVEHLHKIAPIQPSTVKTAFTAQVQQMMTANNAANDSVIDAADDSNAMPGGTDTAAAQTAAAVASAPANNAVNTASPAEPDADQFVNPGDIRLPAGYRLYGDAIVGEDGNTPA